MKIISVLITTIVVLSVSRNIHSNNIVYQELTGAYMGQPVPGNIPEPFAVGILSNSNQVEINSVFSQDGKEFYYVTREKTSDRYDLKYSRRVKGVWSKPVRLPLAGKYSVADIALSPDGNRLYFCSDIPTDIENSEGFDIWYSMRTVDGWAKPARVGDNVNSSAGETQPSFMNDGSMLFPSGRDGSIEGSTDLYISEFVNGKFKPAKRLPNVINTKYNEGNSFISPDGDYILFARWGDPSDGGKGLYISFKKNNEEWGLPKNTKRVLKHYGSLAALSHDKKYLLFSTRKGIYWVDAKILQQLR